MRRLLILLAFLYLPAFVPAYDLSLVKTEHLTNGLTVMVLEDHSQPLVSTQVLYKAGGRNECVGTTGLAHFLEHMAFRSTKNFPDTQDAIYAAGGEWHGYTWIDQTTYFETLPVKHLDLALRLQADRMANVLNRADEVEAERGAVLTELHSYENDPATVLYDHVLAASFQQHPYRYNVIGWTSDVEKITHQDIVSFYQRYYNPSNAVLAVAGDVNADDVVARAREYFGSIRGADVSSLPRTVEPLQQGERRVTLRGSGSRNYFLIAYRAPSARSDDYPAFLLLQAVLGGGSGVNFSQAGFSEDVQAGARLHGIGTRITTFFASTADPYVFNIGGRTEIGVKPDEIEIAVEKEIAEIREAGIPPADLNVARKALLAELIYDIETTEDAAHQMAYFEGIGAFPVLAKLPDLLKGVQVEDLRRVAQKYLKAEQRTIGWYLGDAAPARTSLSESNHNPAAWKRSPAAVAVPDRTMPRIVKLKNGIVLIIKIMVRTPAGFIRVLIPTNSVESGGTPDAPVWRYTSVHRRFLKDDFEPALAEIAGAFTSPFPASSEDSSSLEDPEYVLDKTLKQLIGASPGHGDSAPVLVVVAGDVDQQQVIRLVTARFGKMKAGRSRNTALKIAETKRIVRIPGKAQSQYGYAVPVPRPSEPQSMPYRMLLYSMTHGYGGRLGKEMIHRRGLIYYISSQYHSDGNTSWVSISYGVNPDNLQKASAEFENLMSALREYPPTAEELAEAKEHLIGRRVSAHQSNEEISAFYAREWIEQDRLLSQDEFEKRVHAVTLQQVHDIIPRFLKGVTAIVDTSL